MVASTIENGGRTSRTTAGATDGGTAVGGMGTDGWRLRPKLQPETSMYPIWSWAWRGYAEGSIRAPSGNGGPPAGKARATWRPLRRGGRAPAAPIPARNRWGS